MEKNQCAVKVKQLVGELSKLIEEKALSLYSSGGIDVNQAYPDDDSFELPRILISAALCEVESSVQPLTDNGRQDVENLRKI